MSTITRIKNALKDSLRNSLIQSTRIEIEEEGVLELSASRTWERFSKSNPMISKAGTGINLIQNQNRKKNGRINWLIVSSVGFLSAYSQSVGRRQRDDKKIAPLARNSLFLSNSVEDWKRRKQKYRGDLIIIINIILHGAYMFGLRTISTEGRQLCLLIDCTAIIEDPLR